MLSSGRPSYEEMSQWLKYNPTTGKLHWVKSKKGIKAGSIAGYKSTIGHIQVGFNYKLYYGHVIAWLLMTYIWPEHEIDHINGDGSDNRWKNLRRCNRSQNSANGRRHRDRITNLPKGVYLAHHVKKRPFYSRICAKGTHYRLGYFASPGEAHEAYKKAAKKYFGEFART